MKSALEEAYLAADALGARASQQQANELYAELDRRRALRLKEGREAAEGEDSDLGNPWGFACGTTATVVVLKGSTLFCANAGDSRAVLCRAGGKVLELSTDHKPSLVRTRGHGYGCGYGYG